MATEIKLPPIEDRMKALLGLVAKEIRPCIRCGATIYIVYHNKTHRDSPYTDDGVNHFLNCPHAAEFRKSK